MKEHHKQALLSRARAAVAALYHNASPAWPAPGDFGRYESEFFDWLGDEARHEIEYMNDGGAYGADYRATLGAECNAGRYSSEAARRRYIAKGLRAMELDRARGQLWEIAAQEFGTLYQYGRGGRTLAPDSLIKSYGGSSFGPKRDALAWRESTGSGWGEGYTAAGLTRAIQILESFNEHVRTWCEGVPEMWADYTREREADEAAAALQAYEKGARRIAQERREAIAACREARAARRALAPESVVTLCGMLREAVAKRRRRIAKWRAERAELETQWGDVWRAQGVAA